MLNFVAIVGLKLGGALAGQIDGVKKDAQRNFPGAQRYSNSVVRDSDCDCVKIATLMIDLAKNNVVLSPICDMLLDMLLDA